MILVDPSSMELKIWFNSFHVGVITFFSLNVFIQLNYHFVEHFLCFDKEWFLSVMIAWEELQNVNANAEAGL